MEFLERITHVQMTAVWHVTYINLWMFGKMFCCRPKTSLWDRSLSDYGLSSLSCHKLCVSSFVLGDSRWCTCKICLFPHVNSFLVIYAYSDIFKSLFYVKYTLSLHHLFHISQTISWVVLMNKHESAFQRFSGLPGSL